MAKKTRIEDIDSEAVINSFRLDDTSIPPEARSAGGNAPSPPPKEATQEAAVSLPVPHYKEEMRMDIGKDVQAGQIGGVCMAGDSASAFFFDEMQGGMLHPVGEGDAAQVVYALFAVIAAA